MASSAARSSEEVSAGALATVERNGRSRWWRRRGSAKSGFHYLDHEGRRVTDKEALERVRSLAIPPAWRHVRVSPSPNGRLQAVGVDGAGRVQYRYHERFSKQRQRAKYAKVERFGDHLPPLRQTTTEHLAQDGLRRERVLALAVRLMNDLYIRVGSESSAKAFRTYGLTTLRNRHVEIRRDGRLVFSFRGKSGIRHRHVLVDEELADVMRELKALGGPRLFEYVDEEERIRPLLARDLNQYVKSLSAEEFSCKDFRTWGGTVLAAVHLAEIGPASTRTEAKRNVVRAMRHVASHLGNTATVCRQSYVHPVVLETYLEDGLTVEEFRPRAERRRIRGRQVGLDPEERALLALLRSSRDGSGSPRPARPRPVAAAAPAAG